VLLVPDRDERGLEPAAHGAEPVDPGVASRAQGNQKTPLVQPRTAMVHGELTLSPTRAATAVPVENSLAVTGEATAGMRLARIAAPAESGAQQTCLAAGAEKPGLPSAQRKSERR
jgi:hypothetical protein